MKPFISIDADSSVYDAIVRLHDNNIRHLAVVDADSRDALYLLTDKRILHLLALLVSIYQIFDINNILTLSIQLTIGDDI